MEQLVTNRTEDHVQMLKSLSAKGWYYLTGEERSNWYKVAALGAYNYVDLNRVERAVAELAEAYELDLSTKTDWTIADYPTESQMQRYLGNVKAIQEKVGGITLLVTLPETMDRITYVDANNIEQVLLYAYNSAPTSGILGGGKLGSMVLGV